MNASTTVTLHNCPKSDTSQMFLNQGKDKLTRVYPYNGILLNNKTEPIINT